MTPVRLMFSTARLALAATTLCLPTLLCAQSGTETGTPHSVQNTTPNNNVYGPSSENTPAPSKAPAVIYLFRHAEKPDGDKTDPNLTATGFKRADALPALFIPQPNAARPGTVTSPRLRHPDAIFATAMSKHSNRPVETVTPLARALHEQINNTFEDRDYAGLAAEVLSGKYAGKVVVICWHHREIPHVATALGVTGAPAQWDSNTFNQIWKIEYSGGQGHTTVVSEALLAGDPPAN